MPVVINEFEVVAEPAPTLPSAPAGGDGEGGGADGRESPDLLRLLAEERFREERVRAT